MMYSMAQVLGLEVCAVSVWQVRTHQFSKEQIRHYMLELCEAFSSLAIPSP